MNFDFSEDQHEIKRTARDVLAGRAPLERVRAAAEARTYDDDLWSQLGDLGWPGIAVDEEHGGAGLGTVELAILCEELGYAVTPSPFLACVLAATILQHAGDEDTRGRWLRGLAAGETIGTVGVMRDGGTAELVPDADRAEVIVLLDDDLRGGRVLRADEADVEPVETIDPTRAYARVTPVDGAGVGTLLTGDVALAADRATVLVAAELVGVATRALEMSVAYAKERTQFATPIGAFQAVQHRCAQMLLHTEGARSATYSAAWAADADQAGLPEAASIAKASASDAGREVTASAIQVHGGIGFTWEADVHWLYKRAQLDAQMLGGAGLHRARLSRLAAARLGSGT
jgi:alkylation response protein AidB-like acyl-CoA dehydrogenase